MIRLFDQNIWGNYHKATYSIGNRNALIYKEIKAYDADICAFQECNPTTSRAKEVDIAALMAERYEEVEPQLAERNFTPLFYRRSRFDVLDSGYELYEGLNDVKSKSITWAVFSDRLEGGSFAVLSSHFWWKYESEEDFAQRIANAHQLKACCDRIVAQHAVPVLVTGDFNCGEGAKQGDAPYLELEELGFIDVRKGATRTTDRHTHHSYPIRQEDGTYVGEEMPFNTLDYVFLYNGGAVELASFNVLVDKTALSSSDHCPLLAEFKLIRECETFVNFAHRGASEYAAENTLSSFYLGLRMGANGIETDVQRTRDGVLVLFHDDTISRVTACEGEVADYTYEELCRMRVRNGTTGEEDIVVRFEDFLRYFGWRELTFAIEIKKVGYEKEVIDMLERFDMREKTVVTSFKFACIESVKAYRPDYRVGYLIKDLDDEKYAQMKRIGCEQICPQAKYVTAEKVRAWRELGFSVRAWGVSNAELMKATTDAGVDGMTVNFPDLLTEYLKK